jgi:hypothetical protein
MDLFLREGSREPISFIIKRGNVPYALGTKAVRMKRRNWNKEDDCFATTDTPSLLVVTNAAQGIVTFSPVGDTWLWDSRGSVYLVYFEVEVSPNVWYTFPEGTNLQIKIVPAFGEDIEPEG